MGTEAVIKNCHWAQTPTQSLPH